MVWPELAYEPEATLPDGSPRPAPEPVVFDRELHDFHRKLIRLRNNSPALQVGTFTPLLTDDATGIYAFERRHAGEHIVVVINNGDAGQQVTLRVDGDWVDRLNGERAHPAGAEGLTVDVPARWGAILCRS